MEFEINSGLHDLYNQNYLLKDDYKSLKPDHSKSGVMYGMCKVHKVQLITTTYPHSVQFCQQLVLAITTLQMFLHQY